MAHAKGILRIQSFYLRQTKIKSNWTVFLRRREGLTKQSRIRRNLKADSAVQTIDVERNGKRQEIFPGYLKSSGFSRSALGSRLQPVFTMCKTHHRKSPSCKDNLASQSPETLADFPTTETHLCILCWSCGWITKAKPRRTF